MSLRRVDARFLLPSPVRRAAVLAGADAWREDLIHAGVEVGPAARGLDLVVAAPETAREAAALAPAAVVVEGRRARAHASGLERRSFLPLPRHDDPLVFAPLGLGAPARYAFRHWAYSGSAAKRLRNRAVAEAVAGNVFPPVRSIVSAATEPDRPPYLVGAAREHGLADDVAPLLLAGQGDDYSRGAFLLFEPGAAEPAWTLKFARLPLPIPSFAREERGLRLAAAAGERVASRAPRRLAAFAVDGLQCALETAGRGASLLTLLRQRGRGDRAFDRLCDWLLELSLATAEPPDATEAERRRLADEVLPAWKLDGGLVDRLAAVPAVLQHNDLGTWNVLVDGDEFTVLDWEDAVAHGLPLWDQLYLLADAAAVLDRVEGVEARVDHFVRLFLGELDSSRLVFRRIGEAVEALGLAPEAVGPAATFCWLHHGLAGPRRAEEVPGRTLTEHPLHTALREMARRWLRHPGLGLGWTAWAR